MAVCHQVKWFLLLPPVLDDCEHKTALTHKMCELNNLKKKRCLIESSVAFFTVT